MALLSLVLSTFWRSRWRSSSLLLNWFRGILCTVHKQSVPNTWSQPDHADWGVGGGFTKINVSSRYQNKKIQSLSERFCALFSRMSFLYLQAKLGDICQRTTSPLMRNLLTHLEASLWFERRRDQRGPREQSNIEGRCYRQLPTSKK